MISFQRKPLNTESSIELCLDSSITRVVVRRLRRLRRRSTREKSTRRSRAFPSLSLTRFTSLIVTEIRWYGQVCLIIGFARAPGGRAFSFIRLAFRRRGTGPRASLTVRRVSRVARARAPVPRDARSIVRAIARRWFMSARPSAARAMKGRGSDSRVDRPLAFSRVASSSSSSSSSSSRRVASSRTSSRVSRARVSRSRALASRGAVGSDSPPPPHTATPRRRAATTRMETDADTGRVRVKPALEAVRAHDGPLEIDLGTLRVVDAAPLDVTAADSGEAEAHARERARDVLQRLVAELFALPSETDAHGRFAQLPEPTTTFPRLRALPPSEAPLTKWEKFAKEKGIKKRKRSKEVFDEKTDEWKRRYGYQRARDGNDVIIAPGKMTDVPGKTEDPFTREEREKRERTLKNREKQDKNLMNAVAEKGVKALPPTLRLAVTGKKDSVGSGKLGKREMKDVAARVAHSTASVGKFNAPVPGDDKVKVRGKRRQFASVTDMDSERKKSSEIIDKLLAKEKRGGVVDVNAAARKIQQEKEKANRVSKRKKADGESKERASGKRGKPSAAAGARAKKK